ncbi:MAG: iron-sulfur cluster assembly scaffold protein [Verrucomicrobiia bacterium]
MNPASDPHQDRIAAALQSPKNLGEMTDADAVGTAGSADCGDMMRLWLKFKEGANGQKIIERASFQGFGCETALAVASVATEMLAGKSVAEARALDGQDLSAPLGPLPPMKIHCASLVEEALRQALSSATPPATQPASADPGLIGTLSESSRSLAGAKIVFHPQSSPNP